jgi:predicted extracellular nuclease
VNSKHRSCQISDSNPHTPRVQSVKTAVNGDARTSEGVLVFSSAVDFTTVADLAPGATARATGKVSEFRPSSSDGLRTTEVVAAAADVAVCAAGACAPVPLHRVLSCW